jgi:hypothetical protein
MGSFLGAQIAGLLLAAVLGSPAGFAEARQAFDEGDFEVALKRADTAEGVATDDHQRAEIELFKGLCYAAMGDVGASSDAFRQALRLDPAVALDPKTTAPDLIERLEGIRSTLRGDLLVSANQAQVEIRIDGHDGGPAPYRVQLAPGLHEVEAVPANGGPSVKRTVQVRANGTAEIVVDLGARPPAHEDTP